jgi:hypothetical protein
MEEVATTNAQWKEKNAPKYKQHCKIIKEEFETFVARNAHQMQKKKKNVESTLVVAKNKAMIRQKNYRWRKLL